MSVDGKKEVLIHPKKYQISFSDYHKYYSLDIDTFMCGGNLILQNFGKGYGGIFINDPYDMYRSDKGSRYISEKVQSLFRIIMLFG